MYIPKQPGIYSFYNTVNQTIYIGSTINLRDRIKYRHLKNKASNKHLQNAIKHYGLEAFCITYWVLDSAEKAQEEEQKWLDWIFKNGLKTYNIAVIAGGGRIRACYKNHRDLALKGATAKEWRIKCEAFGGFKAIKRFGLNVKKPDIIYIFESGHDAANKTGCNQEAISYSCNNAKPLNSVFGRWLFSSVSKKDLVIKFNALSKNEITGTAKYKYHFKLLNLSTGLISQEFNTTTLPSKTKGFENVSRSMISLSIKGKIQTVNNYLVLVTKIDNVQVINLKEHFLNRFINKRIRPVVLKALEKIN